MKTEEHNKYVQTINVKFGERAKALGVTPPEIASHLVNLWTNGATREYMLWFGDRSFDVVLKPDDVNVDTMSHADIEAAVRKARAETMAEWIPKIDALTLDATEAGSEVSMAPAPEPAPYDAIAAAVNKLKKRKEASEPNSMLGPISERVDTLEGRLDSSEEQVSQLVVSTETEVTALKSAVRALADRLKKAEDGVNALLAAIAEL